MKDHVKLLLNEARYFRAQASECHTKDSASADAMRRLRNDMEETALRIERAAEILAKYCID